MNPYDPRRDPRDAGTLTGGRRLLPGGSVPGSATASEFLAANVGTETSGSLLGPANQNMLVTIKPTVGRISRHGIIPLTADQDTAGPMARDGRRRRNPARARWRSTSGSERSLQGLPAAASARLHALL